MFLTSLGNAGSPEAMDAVKTYLASQSELERVAAARALRRVTGDAADQMLAGAIGDASARVRISVIDAISEHPASPTLVTVVQRAALGDAEFGVRMRAVRTAADWVGGHPELVATLEQVTESDPQDDIRRAARLGLDSHQSNK
jgi:HEAT repeat protein